MPKKIAAKKKAKAPAKKTVVKMKVAPKRIPAKKKPAAKTKGKPKSKAWDSFGDWWEKVGMKMTDKIEKVWLKENGPNDPDEESGGDHWCVNEMMHNGDAHEMTYEIAERVFYQGKKGEKWEYNQGDSLYCDLDEVVFRAYEAGSSG